jgi:hypothetical protein
MQACVELTVMEDERLVVQNLRRNGAWMTYRCSTAHRGAEVFSPNVRIGAFFGHTGPSVHTH